MSVLTAETIQKYKKFSPSQLKAKAQKVFNAWIRKRDEGLACISCGSGRPEHAGHYLSAGHHSRLRFDERNVHCQCIRCNYFLSGNQMYYRQGLIKKIGLSEVESLESTGRNGTSLPLFGMVHLIAKPICCLVVCLWRVYKYLEVNTLCPHSIEYHDSYAQI